MKNSDRDSKVVVSALVGGLIGIGVIAVYLAVRKKDTSLDYLGKVISNVGEILESNHIEEPAPIKKFGKKLHRNENSIGEIVDWVATGISLWKEFKG